MCRKNTRAAHATAGSVESQWQIATARLILAGANSEASGSATAGDAKILWPFARWRAAAEGARDAALDPFLGSSSSRLRAPVTRPTVTFCGRAIQVHFGSTPTIDVRANR